MGVFGSGASTCATNFEVDLSRFNEVTTTTVPAGTSRVPETGPRLGTSADLLRHLFAAPLKAGAVNPEAGEQNGDHQCDRHLCLL